MGMSCVGVCVCERGHTKYAVRTSEYKKKKTKEMGTGRVVIVWQREICENAFGTFGKLALMNGVYRCDVFIIEIIISRESSWNGEPSNDTNPYII